jgi:hypothetical protein
MARIQKSTQNRCSFTQNFRIWPYHPRIAEFPGLSGFPETLMYAFGRRISARIIPWHSKMKRKAVLGWKKFRKLPLVNDVKKQAQILSPGNQQKSGNTDRI